MNKINQKSESLAHNQASSDLLKRSFLSIAHRGASAYAPENTMAAFDLAYKMGADMIELDVQFSKDGVPLVMHDSFLDVHTDGSGAVNEHSVDELLKLDAGKWFSTKFEEERIPLLSDVLAWSKKKLFINVEIKSERLGEEVDESHVKCIADMISDMELEREILLSSFNYEWIKAFRQKSPEVVTGLLFNRHHENKSAPVELLEQYGADLFHCSAYEMKAAWISQLNREERKFMIYTVNRRKGMLKWINKGAYGIFSDKPDLLVKSAGEFFNQD